ncbi:hypothetical protein B4N89_11820 [Embleya scabrispora]|uniref:Uncharacterized protein n=1 Tax=Embleya scabrispora TaxID=159449 RepID=A0A1T3NXZ9_9ACTN|nr:hypothetical protein [Embleya scabrispora]OPC81540.1 hypothetical protein B4N89_11820 [Embleya scabrispora]
MHETTSDANTPRKHGRSPVTLYVIAVVCLMLVMALVDVAALLTNAVAGENCAQSCPADPTARDDHLVLWAKLSGVAALVSMFLTASLPSRFRWPVGLLFLGGAFVLQAVALTS